MLANLAIFIFFKIKEYYKCIKILLHIVSKLNNNIKINCNYKLLAVTIHTDIKALYEAKVMLDY